MLIQLLLLVADQRHVDGVVVTLTMLAVVLAVAATDALAALNVYVQVASLTVTVAPTAAPVPPELLPFTV